MGALDIVIIAAVAGAVAAAAVFLFRKKGCGGCSGCGGCAGCGRKKK